MSAANDVHGKSLGASKLLLLNTNMSEKKMYKKCVQYGFLTNHV